VVDAVISEPVSRSDSLLTGIYQGKLSESASPGLTTVDRSLCVGDEFPALKNRDLTAGYQRIVLSEQRSCKRRCSGRGNRSRWQIHRRFSDACPDRDLTPVRQNAKKHHHRRIAPGAEKRPGVLIPTTRKRPSSIELRGALHISSCSRQSACCDRRLHYPAAPN
jgi:hypothetical protein